MTVSPTFTLFSLRSERDFPDDEIPDFTPLAHFRTELAKNGTPEGVMINTPAVVSAPFGTGRVVCFSPHPEQTKGLEKMVLSALEWTTRKR